MIKEIFIFTLHLHLITIEISLVFTSMNSGLCHCLLLHMISLSRRLTHISYCLQAPGWHSALRSLMRWTDVQDSFYFYYFIFTPKPLKDLIPVIWCLCVYVVLDGREFNDNSLWEWSEPVRHGGSIRFRQVGLPSVTLHSVIRSLLWVLTTPYYKHFNVIITLTGVSVKLNINDSEVSTCMSWWHE